MYIKVFVSGYGAYASHCERFVFQRRCVIRLGSNGRKVLASLSCRFKFSTSLRQLHAVIEFEVMESVLPKPPTQQ